MSKKTIMTYSVIITLIFSIPAFAMMGGGGSSGHMTGQQHTQAMTSTDHDQVMNNQTGNHIPQTGQTAMGQNGNQTDHGQGNLDHSTMDHSTMDHGTMDADQMTHDAEDFFKE